MPSHYLVTERSADQLRGMLAGEPDRPRRRAAPAAAYPIFGNVRCTSATAAGGSGINATLYPGTLVTGDGENATPIDGGTVWLTTLGTGGTPTAPTSGRVYPCHLGGWVAVGGDSRPRAIAGAGATSGGGGIDGVTALRGWQDPNSAGMPVATQTFSLALGPTSSDWLIIATVNGYVTINGGGVGVLPGYYAALQATLSAAGMAAHRCTVASAVSLENGNSVSGGSGTGSGCGTILNRYTGSGTVTFTVGFTVFKSGGNAFYQAAASVVALRLNTLATTDTTTVTYVSGAA